MTFQTVHDVLLEYGIAQACQWLVIGALSWRVWRLEQGKGKKS